MSDTDDRNDHDRLIRIETLVEGLTQVVGTHTDALTRHIEDEAQELRQIREKFGAITTLEQEMIGIKKDIKEFHGLKNKAIGWIAAIVFAVGIVWELIGNSIKITKGGG